MEILIPNSLIFFLLFSPTRKIVYSGWYVSLDFQASGKSNSQDTLLCVHGIKKIFSVAITSFPYHSSQLKGRGKHKQDVTSCSIDINRHYQYTHPRRINNTCVHTQFSHSRMYVRLHYLLSFSLAKC